MIKTDELPDINTTTPYCTILAALRLGAEKAKPVKDLCSLTGLSDRIVRKHIETMRLAGTCICSNRDGYYLPMTENELQHYIAKMEKTAKSYFLALKSAKRLLKDIQTSDQMHIL